MVKRPPDYMTAFNPFNRQMHEVTVVAWLEIEDYLITLSNSETWSSAVTKKLPDIHVFKAHRFTFCSRPDLI